MIGRRVKVQLAAFVVLTLVGISVVSARYVGLGSWLFHQGYVVSADFASSGGIFPNAEVTYRGVTVGRVERLRLAVNGVWVDMRIDPGVRIPADVRAVVEDRSVVGEQYVDLRPRRAGPPYLSNRSEILQADTATPVPVTTVLVNLDRLVNSVNRANLTTVIDQLGRGFAGTGPDLARLIDAGNALLTTANENLPQTVALLRSSATVLGTQNAQGPAIRSFAHDLALLSGTLRTADPNIRTILDQGPQAAGQVQGLLQADGPALGQLVGNLLTGAQVAVVHIPGIRQVLITYPVVVDGGFTVVPGDGTAHFGLVINANNPPPCTRGYQATVHRLPQDTAPVPTNDAAGCTEPRGSLIDVRGAQNAPQPGGSVTSGGGGSLQGQPSTSAASSPTAGSAALVGGYDPLTGQVFAPDGRPLWLGTQGGQYALLGGESWQWLLIGPLAR
ncbi:MAG: MCE family protein [Actinomycetes bacterium]